MDISPVPLGQNLLAFSEEEPALLLDLLKSVIGLVEGVLEVDLGQKE